MTTAAVFDKEAALDRVDNDRELLLELMDMAIADGEQKMSSLKQAAKNQQAARIAEIAHAMKSAFGNVGAMQCHALSAEIERAAKKDDLSAIDPQIASLEAAIAEFGRAQHKFKKADS